MNYLVAFILGSCSGSFLVLLSQRLPLKISIVTPPSHCFYCQTRLKINDLIPIYGYLKLRGRCRYCDFSFSALSFITELSLGLFFIFLTYYHLWQWQYLSYFLLLIQALCLTLTDILYLLVEPWLLYPLSGLISLMILLNLSPLSFHPLAALITLITLSLFNLSKSRLGQGDLKLLSLWAFFLGLVPLSYIIFLASLLALIFSLSVYRHQAWQRQIPFVPFLSLGLLIYLSSQFFL